MAIASRDMVLPLEACISFRLKGRKPTSGTLTTYVPVPMKLERLTNLVRRLELLPHLCIMQMWHIMVDQRCLLY